MFGGIIGAGTGAIGAVDLVDNNKNLFVTDEQDIMNDHEKDLSDAEDAFQDESKDLGEAKRKLENCLNANKK